MPDLKISDVPELRYIVKFVAWGNCHEQGGLPPKPQCNCIACQAARVEYRLWPDPTMDLTSAISLVEEDVLPWAKRQWIESGQEEMHCYIALRVLIRAAKS
jgi:hypothetical protein